MRTLVISALSTALLLSPLHSQNDSEKEALFIEANKAGTVLKEFLDAETWEAAADFVLDAETLRPVMEKHYSEFDWLGQEIIAIRGTGASVIPGKEVFHVVRADLVVKGHEDYVRVTLVQVGDTYKLDWEPFAQAYDSPVESFLEKQPEGSRFFRMGLYRGTIFPEFESLGIEQPVRFIADWKPNTELRVDLLTSLDSPLGKLAAETVPYDDFVACRVKVQWNKSGSKPYLELEGFETIDVRSPSVVSGPLN